MVLKGFYAFYFCHLCMSAVVPEPAFNTTQSLSAEEQSIYKRDLGLFDKGLSWSNADNSVTLKVPAAHFCGSETLENVARYSNPEKYGTTSLRAYYNDLEKADITTRKNMVRNTALRIAGTITPACDATLDGQLSRKLLTTTPQNRMSITTTALKIAWGVGGASAVFGLNYALATYPNTTGVVDTVLVAVGTVAANIILFSIISAMNDPHQATRQLLDAYRAAAMVLNALAIERFIRYANRILSFGCPVMSQNDQLQASLALNTWDAKDSDANVRPASVVDQVNSQPNKNACPSNPLEAGNSGEVVG